MIDFSITHLLVACLGLGLGISLSYYYRKRESLHSEARRNLEHENELLKSSLELSRRQEQLMEDFSNKLAVSSQSLIKEMKEETKSYFSEKSKTIESILTPVQATLTAFKQNLETFETKHAEDRGSLKNKFPSFLLRKKT